jgi:hypothetical protein
MTSDITKLRKQVQNISMQGNHFIYDVQDSNLPEVQTTGQHILEEECPT